MHKIFLWVDTDSLRIETDEGIEEYWNCCLHFIFDPITLSNSGLI